MTPTYQELFRVFGRIGMLSFGGPAAQIALMHRELVENRDWLDEDGFLRALSLCMLLPGPEAMQLATYAGWRMRGVQGGLLAGALFVLPGALIIGVLVWLYAAFGDMPVVQSAFLGVKAAVIIIVVQALRKVSSKALTSPSAWGVAGMAFLAIFALNLPFPLIVLAAAVWGGVTSRAAAPLDIPMPPTARPLRTVLIWGTLWLVPLMLLSVTGQTLLAEIGWFFARLAVVTFGGAYAVLAYMTQTVVSDYQWLTTPQMIDALGLAETTPGPLILVTQFVAMLTGFLLSGPSLAIAAGIVALWATFTPCFLWIFLAGPYLEQISSRPRLTAALSAITAAVVGVILNLSLWFALHVWFSSLRVANVGPIAIPVPDLASLDVRAALLSVFAAVLMLGLKAGMATTVAAGACVSVIWTMFTG